MGEVFAGETPFLRILARLLRFPRPAPAARVSLRVAGTSRGEIWRRQFDGRALVTRVALRHGRFAERCRGVELRFDLQGDSSGLRYVQRGAALAIGPLRLPLPAVLAPRVDAHDEPGEGPLAIRFSVDLRLWGRRVVGYAGTVFPEDPR